MTEWLAALKSRFPKWKLYTSKHLAHRDYHWGQDYEGVLNGLAVEQLDALHLAVPMRSFRAEKLSEFVGALIAGEGENARALYVQIKDRYPIVLNEPGGCPRLAKEQARGPERVGLVASSGASRLKPEGLNVHENIGATHWFLNGKDDVRSSYYLEDPATEFDIQRLQLDWVGVCWDADFRLVDGRWAHHSFSGTKWKNVNDPSNRRYLTSAYRVLLTERAKAWSSLFLRDVSDRTRCQRSMMALRISGRLRYLRATLNCGSHEISTQESSMYSHCQ